MNVTVTKHRATCSHPGCERVWRENCQECLEDMADKHRRETGHEVEVSITIAETLWEMLQSHRSRMVLISQKKGW